MKHIIITACVCMSILALVAFNSNRSGNRDSEYTIVWGSSTEDLARKIKNNLNAGWVLTGGVTYAERSYLQAMYKK